MCNVSRLYAFSQEYILDTKSTKHLPKVKAVPLSICGFPKALTKQKTTIYLEFTFTIARRLYSASKYYQTVK